ncbi:MAG: two-component system sensor histidine kinase NtrB [Bradymonadaceae bacterium]
MVDQVEHRAFEALIRVARLKGLSESALTQDLPFTHETVLQERGYVSWDDFATYCRRFEDALGGPEALADVGQILKDTPSYGALLRLGGLFTSPKWFFQVLMRWFGPAMTPAVRYRDYEELDEHTLRVTLYSPADGADCPAYFRIVESFFHYGPGVIGIQPPIVSMELAPREATYTIQLAPSKSLGARLKRTLQSAWSGQAMLDELAEQHESLLDSYRKLQRSESSFRMLIENSPEGVVVFTRKEIIYANPSMHAFLGATRRDELIGRSIEDIYRDPEKVPLGEELEAKPSIETMQRNEEVAFQKFDGELVWAEVNTIAVQFDGRPSYVSLVRDITLRHQVLARAMEMDRMISMGVLAAGVGHEIKNPLAFLKANVDFSRSAIQDIAKKFEAGAFADEDPRELQEEFDEIDDALETSQEGAERLLSIAQDLSLFSRTTEHQLEAVMLEDVIRTALNVARHEIRHRAEVVTDFGSIPPVRGNATQLSQVLLNLLINAAHAIPEGDSTGNQIRIRTYRSDEHVIVEVEDTGIGIPSENLEKIFEPFFTTKPPGKGTGLGMAISRRLTEGMGGELRVESEPGVGTVFTVVLDVYDSDED